MQLAKVVRRASRFLSHERKAVRVPVSLPFPSNTKLSASRFHSPRTQNCPRPGFTPRVPVSLPLNRFPGIDAQIWVQIR
jgi:hypothetical protein